MSKSSVERYELKKQYFEYLKDTANSVDAFVEQFIQNGFQKNAELKDEIMSRYRFGKPQLRPAQVRLAYELVGGADWGKSIPACASIEIKDTGYYCIDDVLDSGGNPRLILLGALFNSVSYAMMNDLSGNFSPDKIKKVTAELLNLDANNLQAAMIDLNLKEPNFDRYMQKAQGYNFWEHALKIGAVLGGASEKNIALIGLAGRNIGIGYIIANDTWDFGKELEDFRAGKYTLPIMWAFENVYGIDKRKLASLFFKPDIDEEEKNEVRRIMVRSKTIEYGQKKAQEFCNRGIELLKQFPESVARKMLEFSTTMTQRNKHYNFLKQFE